MNDFTKEELQDILGAISILDGFLQERGCGKGLCASEIELLKKIQSLIDNYPKCDHRSGMSNYNEKGEVVGYDSDIYRCRHCSILFRFIFENGQCIGAEELE